MVSTLANIDAGLMRKFFRSSFEPYAGQVGGAGFFDFADPMVRVQDNVLAAWKAHFVEQEEMQMVTTTNLTPHKIFEASGHVAKFADIGVKDSVTGNFARLDHLVEGWCEAQLALADIKPERRAEMERLRESAGSMTKEELAGVVKQHEIKSAEGNPLTDPIPLNLMFQAEVGFNTGEHGAEVAYLRPELAQGIILNFKNLLESNQGKLPFAAACIGTAYRNEIAPRNGLVRCREFLLAEFEHFLQPGQTEHPEFHTVAGLELPLMSQQQQAEDPTQAPVMTLGNAVEQGIIKNQTLAYFLGRVYIFLHDQLNCKQIRFRQHLQKEMAHYARDCWDAEMMSSTGWLECVGVADRSAHDLRSHSENTTTNFKARIAHPKPIVKQALCPDFDKKELMKAFKQDGKDVFEWISTIQGESAEELQAQLGKDNRTIEVKGRQLVIPEALKIEFKEKEIKETGISFLPEVVEASFGIGRILLVMLQQNYVAEKDRTVIMFPPRIASRQVCVGPVVTNKPVFINSSKEVKTALKNAGISCTDDVSGQSIGKRYARADEIGIPYFVTIDGDTLGEGEQTAKSGTVTIRDRDSKKQGRCPKDNVPETIQSLLAGRIAPAEFFTE